jgi:tRNA A-37 threonylcarbamoyl transferase component Bud32
VVGETIAGRYEVEELVGHGGMSSVYKAHDALLERNVALKILHEQYNADEEFVERFKREARSVAQLQHPNIVTVIDRGEEDGRQYIVFEYIDGENLKELVVKRGRLDVREALEIAVEVARALAFAHGHGLVHRDVKPQNVLLNGDGRAKVTDFGIARSVDVEGMTSTGMVLGTSNYIAPEQASGEPVDAHTDVYALGVVIYELLAGEVPFPGESFVAVAMKHVHEPPPNVLEKRPEVPLRVAAAIDRALEKNPEERFPTMDAFAAELEACLAELDREDDGDATLIVPRLRHTRRRGVWRLPAGIAVLALLAITAIVTGLVMLGGGDGKTAGAPIGLQGIASFDPEGDQEEHDGDVAFATDRDAATFWRTEEYRSTNIAGKSGVGIVLDAGQPVEAASMRVRTDTPGFTAEIRAGNLINGPFRKVSDTKTVAGLTTFDVDPGAPVRYYVVWITKLAGAVAHVNEARAFEPS